MLYSLGNLSSPLNSLLDFFFSYFVTRNSKHILTYIFPSFELLDHLTFTWEKEVNKLSVLGLKPWLEWRNRRAGIQFQTQTKLVFTPKSHQHCEMSDNTLQQVLFWKQMARSFHDGQWQSRRSLTWTRRKVQKEATKDNTGKPSLKTHKGREVCWYFLEIHQCIEWEKEGTGRKGC